MAKSPALAKADYSRFKVRGIDYVPAYVHFDLDVSQCVVIGATLAAPSSKNRPPGLARPADVTAKGNGNKRQSEGKGKGDKRQSKGKGKGKSKGKGKDTDKEGNGKGGSSRQEQMRIARRLRRSSRVENTLFLHWRLSLVLSCQHAVRDRTAC